mgnify:CR=1 FL=1
MSEHITTANKVHFKPLEPQKEDILIEDIAHALSLMTRANGHFPEFYSVGQHCVGCFREAAARGLSDRIQLMCLLHDASEAYIADITRPVKRELKEYLSIESRLQDAIYERFLGKLPTEEERKIKMEQLRPVSKLEKILFPIIVTIVVVLILPDTAALVGSLMLGNLFRESGVVKQLQETASNALMYIVVILLGTSVGATTSAQAFIQWDTIKIVALGLIAFAIGTASGVLFGKLMCKATKGKINPLIGSAGVSAVPMAARVSQKVGSEADPSNFLLMHAMGPNVAGVIGTAVAAGVFMAIFGV